MAILIDILDVPDVHIKQEKYSGSFNSSLQASQDLVHDIGYYLKRSGLYIRAEDDTVPFVNIHGRKMRLCDIMAIHEKRLEIIFFEAKDHCRCLYYDVTGEPQRYINQKLKLLNGGARVYILFRENMEWVEKKAKLRGVSIDNIIDQLEKEGLVKKRDGGGVYFAPYGHNLKFLLQEENMRTDLEDRIPTHFGKYKGEKSFLWKVNKMLPIDQLLAQEF